MLAIVELDDLEVLLYYMEDTLIPEDSHDEYYEYCAPLMKRVRRRIEETKTHTMTSIDWHPYPGERPQKSSDYLVTVKEVGTEQVNVRFYNDWAKKFTFNDKKIVAWAEIPEPYRSTEEEK